MSGLVVAGLLGCAMSCLAAGARGGVKGSDEWNRRCRQDHPCYRRTAQQERDRAHTRRGSQPRQQAIPANYVGQIEQDLRQDRINPLHARCGIKENVCPRLLPAIQDFLDSNNIASAQEQMEKIPPEKRDHPSVLYIAYQILRGCLNGIRRFTLQIPCSGRFPIVRRLGSF